MQSTVQSVLNTKELRSTCSKGLEVSCQDTFKAFIKRLIKECRAFLRRNPMARTPKNIQDKVKQLKEKEKDSEAVKDKKRLVVPLLFSSLSLIYIHPSMYTVPYYLYCSSISIQPPYPYPYLHRP